MRRIVVALVILFVTASLVLPRVTAQTDLNGAFVSPGDRTLWLVLNGVRRQIMQAYWPEADLQFPTKGPVATLPELGLADLPADDSLVFFVNERDEVYAYLEGYRYPIRPITVAAEDLAQLPAGDAVPASSVRPYRLKRAVVPLATVPPTPVPSPTRTVNRGLQAPKNLIVTSNTANSRIVSWSPVEGAAGYNLYRLADRFSYVPGADALTPSALLVDTKETTYVDQSAYPTILGGAYLCYMYVVQPYDANHLGSEVWSYVFVCKP